MHLILGWHGPDVRSSAIEAHWKPFQNPGELSQSYQDIVEALTKTPSAQRQPWIHSGQRALCRSRPEAYKLSYSALSVWVSSIAPR